MDEKDSEKYNCTSKPEKRNRSSSESSSKNVNHKKHKRKHKQSSDTEFSSSHRKKRSKHCKHNKKHKKEREQNKRDNSFDVPISLMNSNKEMAPMTKNEWEKKQSVIKRVFDESSGRYRLIKGDGEVIEEIVSKEKQKEINQQATREDGIYFQTQLSTHLKK